MQLCRTILHRIGQLSSVRLFHSSKPVAQKLDLAGIYPPIPTPFDCDENIDWLALKDNMNKWNKLPFKGYVVQGSNGEYAYMSEKERVQLVGRVKKMIDDKSKLLIGGSGCESTRSTIDMSNKMAEAGADAVLVVTPSYYRSGMTDAAMLEHYTKVADNSNVPVIVYNCPSNTVLDLNADLITKLAAHPNIIGLKDSGGDISKLGAVVYQTRQLDFQVIAGSASFLYAAYHLGCVGGIVALANVLGEECCQLEALFKSGDWKAAEELQKKLIVPNVDVTRRFGVPGLKQAMDWLGYVGGRTRLPLLPLSSGDTDILRKHFKKAGFLKD